MSRGAGVLAAVVDWVTPGTTPFVTQKESCSFLLTEPKTVFFEIVSATSSRHISVWLSVL